MEQQDPTYAAFARAVAQFENMLNIDNAGQLYEYFGDNGDDLIGVFDNALQGYGLALRGEGFTQPGPMIQMREENETLKKTLQDKSHQDIILLKEHENMVKLVTGAEDVRNKLQAALDAKTNEAEQLQYLLNQVQQQQQQQGVAAAEGAALALLSPEDADMVQRITRELNEQRQLNARLKEGIEDRTREMTQLIQDIQKLNENNEKLREDLRNRGEVGGGGGEGGGVVVEEEVDVVKKDENIVKKDNDDIVIDIDTVDLDTYLMYIERYKTPLLVVGVGNLIFTTSNGSRASDSILPKYLQYANKEPTITVPKTVIFRNVRYEPRANVELFQNMTVNSTLDEVPTNYAYYHLRFDVDVDSEHLIPVGGGGRRIGIEAVEMPTAETILEATAELLKCRACANKQCQDLRENSIMLAEFLNRMKDEFQKFKEPEYTWPWQIKPPPDDEETYAEAMKEARGATANIWTNYHAAWVHPESGEIRTSDDDCFVPISKLRQLPDAIKNLMPIMFDAIMECLNLTKSLILKPNDVMKTFVVMSLLNRIERVHMVGVINYLLEQEQVLLKQDDVTKGDILLAPGVSNLMEGTRVWFVFSTPRTVGPIDLFSQIVNLKHIQNYSSTGRRLTFCLNTNSVVYQASLLGDKKLNSFEARQPEYVHRLKTICRLFFNDAKATATAVVTARDEGQKPNEPDKMPLFVPYRVGPFTADY